MAVEVGEPKLKPFCCRLPCIGSRAAPHHARQKRRRGRRAIEAEDLFPALPQRTFSASASDVEPHLSGKGSLLPPAAAPLRLACQSLAPRDACGTILPAGCASRAAAFSPPLSPSLSVATRISMSYATSSPPLTWSKLLVSSKTGRGLSPSDPLSSSARYLSSVNADSLTLSVVGGSLEAHRESAQIS